MSNAHNLVNLSLLQARFAALLPGGRLQHTALPLVPELALYLVADTFSGQRLAPEVTKVLMESPPYWSFCWASGQVTARWLLDNPQWVAGKTVLDVGCGSGVVAIAAALAGARRVIACDIDPDALLAARVNAQANGVQLEYSEHWQTQLEAVDCLLASDILYDRDNLSLLEQFVMVPQVLVADSRVKNFDYAGYDLVGSWQASTWPDLAESAEFNQVRLYRKD